VPKGSFDRIGRGQSVSGRLSLKGEVWLCLTKASRLFVGVLAWYAGGLAYHDQVSLDGYLSILRARWLTVVAVIVVSVLGTALYSFNATPRYQAHAGVFFSVSVSDNAGTRARGFTYQQTQVRVFAQLATLPIVLNPVITKLGLATTPDKLADEITAQAPLNTPIVDINVSASSREQAISIAAAVAAQLSTTVISLAPKVDNGTATVVATTVDPATAGNSPAVPRTKLNLVIALLFGAIIGALAAVALDARAGRALRRRQLEALGGVAVVGTVTMPVDAGKGAGAPRWADSLQELQLRLFPPLQKRTFSSVAITSGGDPTLSARLATGLAAAQNSTLQRVLLIDANLHHPSVGASLGLPASAGLAGVLRGAVDLDAATQRVGKHGLDVLAAGSAPLDPTGMVDSDEMRTLLHRAAQRYDLVIVNTPPFVTADGLAMARLTDRAVVVLARQETRGVLGDSLATLRVARVQVLGLVVST
jgi:succinoglycan biosynthesis transport protein ExoP